MFCSVSNRSSKQHSLHVKAMCWWFLQSPLILWSIKSSFLGIFIKIQKMNLEYYVRRHLEWCPIFCSMSLTTSLNANVVWLIYLNEKRLLCSYWIHLNIFFFIIIKGNSIMTPIILMSLNYQEHSYQKKIVHLDLRKVIKQYLTSHEAQSYHHIFIFPLSSPHLYLARNNLWLTFRCSCMRSKSKSKSTFSKCIFGLFIF